MPGTGWRGKDPVAGRSGGKFPPAPRFHRPVQANWGTRKADVPYTCTTLFPRSKGTFRHARVGPKGSSLQSLTFGNPKV